MKTTPFSANPAKPGSGEAHASEFQSTPAGIDRAFEVIRNHTDHTRGYVLTALKLIEEYGTGEDKALLNELLRSKNEVASATLSSLRKEL